MKYLRAFLIGFVVIIVGSFVLPFVFPDAVWAFNASLFGGIAVGIGYYFWREHQHQERVDEIIEDA